MNTETNGTQTVILQLDSKAAATYANAKMVESITCAFWFYLMLFLITWGIRTLWKARHE